MSKIIDEIGNKELMEKLQSLGLSPKEAAVYMALLPRRDIGSSKLIQATGLHGQFVYAALGKLEELGLARHVIQNGRKKFSANSPQRLLSLVEEKRLAAHAVARELQARFAGAHEQDFEVYQGESAFIAHQMQLLERQPEGQGVDVIATQTEQYTATLQQYGMGEEFERVRMERKIAARYIGTEAQRPTLDKWEKERKLWTRRYFPGLSTGAMSIDVWHDCVSFITYGEPMLCFTLTNKDTADGYRQFFEALWRVAKK